MIYKPYPDQEECINAIVSYNSMDPGVVMAPTSFGKSIVISEVARRLGGGVLVLHPSKELLEQNIFKFSQNNIDFCVYSASVNRKEIGPITFGTLLSVDKDVEGLKSTGIHTVIIDECDSKFPRTPGSVFMRFITALKPKKVIGLTATPWNTEITPFGARLKLLTNLKKSYFKRFVYIAQIKHLIDSGRWTKCLYEARDFDDKYLKLNSDLSNYTEESILETNIINSVNRGITVRVKELLTDGLKHILVFVDSAENAKKFSEWLEGSVYVDSSMSIKQRTKAVGDFISGKAKVMFNYGVLSVGFDFPKLQAIIMGRPTRSLRLYYQIWGRGVRKCEGKEHFKFIDLCGNIDRFGRVEDIELKYADKIGYFLSSGNIMLSDVYIGSRNSISDFLSPRKEKLEPLDKSFKIKHGKYKEKGVMSPPIFYLKWVLKEVKPDNPYNRKLIEECGKAIKLKESFIK